MRKLNLNPFSEKLLHRYLLECMYDMVDGKSTTRRRLLPDGAPTNRPNLVVPELARESARPDLTLYYRDSKPIPIEVKWKSSLLTDSNQIMELKKAGNGHLISLVEDSQPPEGITSSVIDFDHFCNWLGKRSISLARDSASSFGRQEDRQYWIFSPRGSLGSSCDKNYKKMRAKIRGKKHFWAFRNKPDNVRNHLGIRKGDRLLMLIQNARGLKTGEAQTLSKNGEKLPLNIFRWIEYEALIPYSIDLEDELSTFFEDGDPEPGERRWPHFIHLRMISEGGNITLPSRGDLSLPVFTSDIKGGGPVNISQSLFDNTMSKLHSSSWVTR